MHSGELIVSSASTVTCLGTTLEATGYTTQYIGGTGLSATTIQGCNIVGVQRGRGDGLGASGIVFTNSSDTWAINNNISNFSQVGWSVLGNNPASSVTSQRNHIIGGSISYVMSNGMYVTHADQHSSATNVKCLWTGDACTENTTNGATGDTVQVGYFTADGVVGDNVVAGCLSDGSVHSRCINSTFTNVVSFCAQAIGDSFSTPYFASDADITNNKCVNTDTGATGVAAIGFEGLTGGKIQDNKIVNGSTAIAGIASGTAATGVMISGNHIFNPTKYGIMVPGNASNMTLTGNYIDQNSNAGYAVIDLSNQYGSVSDSVISDNVIVNACTGQAYGAIDLSSAVNVNGAGNSISPGCTQAWRSSIYSSGSTLSQISEIPNNSVNLTAPTGQQVTETGGTGTSYSYEVQAYGPDNTYTLPSNTAAGVISTASYVSIGTARILALKNVSGKGQV
jgi:hypothetical protein